MKRNIFWTLWGITVLLCVFTAGYKSFAIGLREHAEKQKIIYLKSNNSFKVLKIYTGNKEKLALIKLPSDNVITVHEGMNLSNKLIITKITDNYIETALITNPKTKIKFYKTY